MRIMSWDLRIAPGSPCPGRLGTAITHLRAAIRYEARSLQCSYALTFSVIQGNEQESVTWFVGRIGLPLFLSV